MRRASAFVVVESLFSMDGDLAPLARATRRCAARPARCSSWTKRTRSASTAQRGSGLHRGRPARCRRRACVSINTAGKALGVAGAFVAGPAWAIEYLIQRARPFVFSTAPPPALADAHRREPDDRRATSPSAATACSARAVSPPPAAVGGARRAPTATSQIVPVVIGDNERAVAVARALQAEGFDVRAIRPPTRAGRHRAAAGLGERRPAEETLDRFVDRARGRAQGGRPLFRGLFVTGTDTGVGKTVVSAALHAPLPGDCRAFATGSRFRPASSRTMTRRRCAGLSGVRRDEVCWTTACGCRARCRRISRRALAGQRIDLDRRWSLSRGSAAAGGSLDRRRRRRRPGAVNERDLMIDLMVRLGLPVLVVARTGLGTINHTLLTLEALRARALAVAGVVMVGEPRRRQPSGDRDVRSGPGRRRTAAARSAHAASRSLGAAAGTASTLDGHLAEPADCR